MRFCKAVISAAVLSVLSIPSITLAKSSNQHDLMKSLFKKAGKVEIENLSEAARSAKKLVGSAVSYGVLSSADTTYATVLANEFDYITPENSGKWGSLQPIASDQWDFTQHDTLVEFATNNDKLYKGHTLVWHSQLPSFINDSLSAEELKEFIYQHIDTTMSRYQGEFLAWDVVNEAIADSGEYRDSIFYQKLGTDYIAAAFRQAHRLDRKAHLYYNDYNIAGINAKSNAVYEMLKGLVEAGVPVDGVGFQMHLSAGSAPGYEELVANFQRFADLGLLINISELDVRVADLPWDQTTKLAIQRQVYHRVTSACMQFKQCESLTTWGFTDAYSWIDTTFGNDDPLPLDEAYQRKPAYYGLLNGFLDIAPDPLGSMPNLIANDEFEAGIEGWTSWGGQLARINYRDIKGKSPDHSPSRSALMVTGRTESWHSAVYDIVDLVRPGRSYDVSAFAKIFHSKSDFVALSIAYRCESEADVYLNLANDTAKKRWVQLRGQFTTPECPLEAASLYIEGPEAGVDLAIDQVSLKPTMLVPDDTGLGPNIIANSGFEGSADGWFGFGSATVSASMDSANSGNYSGLVSNRDATWQGPATSVYLDAVPGTQYQLLTWVRMVGNSNQVNATVKATCMSDDQYIVIGSANASADGWTTISGTFTVPQCDLLDLTLYFEGPAVGEDFYIDDVYVRQVLASVTDTNNLVSNSGFETGIQGWSSWGGLLSASSAQAHSGSNSILLSNRSGTWQGPLYDLLNQVVAGSSYQISAWGRIAGSMADTLNITVKTACDDGSETYHQVASVTASDSDWTQLEGTLSLPSCNLTQVFLYFDGPAIEADIFIDDVFVSGDAAEPTSNLVGNPGFENGLDGWVTWGGNLQLTSLAHSGEYAALLTERTGTWQGPVYYLLSTAQSGESYDIAAWVRVQGAASANVNITVKTVCDDGSESYLWAGGNTVNDSGWTQVNGAVTLPSCTLTEVSLYFDGPDIGIDTLLDDVDVSLSL